MKLERFAGNPVLTPSSNWWEEYLVFNAGAATYNGKTHLLYRAQGRDKISRFGLAVSSDGYKFERFADPVVEGDENNKFERLGIEDPRITQVGETYYIFYTAASVYPLTEAKNVNFAPSLSSKVPWRVRVSLMTTEDFRQFQKLGIVIPDLDTKDLALFPEQLKGKWYLCHRVYPNMYLSTSDDLKTWKDSKIFATTRPGNWDSERIGVGAPPMKTEKGWLLFYHGADDTHVYRLGIMLLDINDPAKILYRSSEPILEPEAPYEKEGYVKNVVFTCGAVDKDGQYLVYYGAADKVIGVATIDKTELLESLP